MYDNNVISLAKHLLFDCVGNDDITLPKPTLKIILDELVNNWQKVQVNTRSNYKEVKNGK